ncbi:hypothetical protein [Glutamicibacter uratoxydans]|uniref:hypothetical protein n=1 Tax=Glutamicibacter uratoxydans TaxID=43667 RepID=UPI0011426504|nr:hypothetical protein [Glutamicibacter uratoxydans]
MSLQVAEPAAPPNWAVQRVATVMQRQEASAQSRPDAKRVAQKAGISKSLARRCIVYLAAKS